MILRQVIKEKGFTIERLANEMGIGRVTLQQNLARDSMSTNTLRKIANILGCQIGDFFLDEMSEQEHKGTYSCPHCGSELKIKINIE